MKRRGRGGIDSGGTPHKFSVDRDGLATSFVSPSNEFYSKWKKSESKENYPCTVSITCNIYLGPNPSPFSLNEEARKTRNHSVAYNDNQLRFSKVTFISAGNPSPKDLNDPKKVNPAITAQARIDRHTISEALPQEQLANLSLGKPSNVKAMTSRSGAVTGAKQAPSTTPAEEPYPTNSNSFFYIDLHGSKGPDRTLNVAPQRKSALQSNSDLFYVDLDGSRDLAQPTLPMPRIRRSQSPTGSSASDEVILFNGRESAQGKKRNLETFHMSAFSKPSPIVVSDRDEAASDARSVGRDDPIRAEADLPSSSKTKHIRGFPLNSQPGSAQAGPKPAVARAIRKTGRPFSKKTFQKDAIVADYISNIDYEDTGDFAGHLTLPTRQLDTLETSAWEDEPDESDEKRQAESITSFSENWDITDLQDFDELSTSVELLAEVKHVISKRSRPSGVQYLVVYEGHISDEARWIHVSSLESKVAQEKILSFEGKQSEAVHGYVDDTSDESGEEAQMLRDVQDEMEDILDEQDLFDRSLERMSDEDIARLLSKQEQFGIRSNEVLLCDTAAPTQSGKAGRKKQRHRSSADFPSASLPADVLGQDPYDGFDVLDTERLSLKKKSKGPRGTVPLEVSDSELEATLEAAWAYDRTKKKKRKQERQELRAQGLLDKKGKTDLKAKYSQGMEIIQVLEEVKRFLASPNES